MTTLEKKTTTVRRNKLHLPDETRNKGLPVIETELDMHDDSRKKNRMLLVEMKTPSA